MEKINAETLHEIVKKLVGEIDPIGCGSRDPERHENLKVLTSLIDHLTQDVKDVYTHNKYSKESSVKYASDYAIRYLNTHAVEILE